MAAAAVLAFGLGACGLFVDTDGLTGGDVVSVGGSDGSVDANVGGDGSSGPSDSGTTSDAAPFDANAPKFCDSHPGHSYCVDFDESLTIPPDYDDTSFTAANFFIDPSISVSAPNSLYAKFTVGDSSEGVGSNVTYASGSLALALDVRFSSSDLSTGQIVPFIAYVPKSSGQSEHYFYLQVYYGSFNIGEALTADDGGAPTYASTTLVSPTPKDTWMHVDILINGSTGKVTASFDGTSITVPDAQAGFGTGAGYVTLGAYANDLPADAIEHLDNITFDL
ncbi:MAG: hypothetical protein ABI461_02365 [Polyangiaceae bacterium]